MKKVLIFGTFDGLHPGHLNLLEQARAHGDHLTVVIARDATVRTHKKHDARLSEDRRREIMSQSPLVNETLLGNTDDPYRIIEDVRPDVICLGYDQKIFVDQLRAELFMRGLKAEIVRCKAFHPEKYKSSFMHRGANKDE